MTGEILSKTCGHKATSRKTKDTRAHLEHEKSETNLKQIDSEIFFSFSFEQRTRAQFCRNAGRFELVASEGCRSQCFSMLMRYFLTKNNFGSNVVVFF